MAESETTSLQERELHMTSSYIVAGCRTPIGRYLGGLASLRSVELGGAAIRGVLERSKIDAASIDQVIMGQVIAAGVGQAPARQAGMLGGLPTNVGAVTVNKVCGSGLYAAMMADVAIRAGEYRRVIAGGMESMSQAPHLLRSARAGWKYGEQSLLDAIDIDGLRCAQLGLAMGCVGEWTAKDSSISRQAQDEWSVRSHTKAIAAQDSGLLAKEIVPINVIESKKQVVRELDEGPRRDCTLDGLAKLKPAFLSALVQSDGESSYAGTVTAGNASTLSDGAAAVLVVDEESLHAVAPELAFRIVGHCSYAADHQRIFTAPVGAVNKLLSNANLNIADVDSFEINEAFASQTLACVRQLGIDQERVNAHGGAIALGHPLGCSGTRVLVTLMHRLGHTGGRRGMATLCLGGGEAVAMLIERVNV